MFEWFYNMPDWLYGIVFGTPAFAFVFWLCRNEIKAWYKSASEPNFWELARAEQYKPSGLGWLEKH